MRKLITSILFTILLYSCAGPSIHLQDRQPAEDLNCEDIVQNLIHHKPLTEDEVKFASYFKLKASPYYKLLWDDNSYHYVKDFWQLKLSGSREIKLLEEFGFEVAENKITAPTLETFILRYQQYLDANKIPLDSRIMPALSIVNKKNEELVKLHNPLLPWKEKLSEWGPKIGLRLKGRQVTEGLANGLFPLFTDGYHDVFHFITFALHPDYAKNLIEKNKSLVKLKLNRSILNRSSYALEALTLADSSKLKEIMESITLKHVNKYSTINDFQDEVNKLTEEELKNKVDFWSKNFQKYLVFYSGGMAEPIEKATYSEMLKAFFSSYLRNHFSENQTVNGIHKIMPTEILYDGMTFMDKALVTLSKSSQSYINEVLSSAKIIPTKDELLRLQVARMEYALWKSAAEINYTVWINDTVKESADKNSSTMQFIKDCFGEKSLIYRLFE